MKALEDMTEEPAGGQETETVASVLDTLVEETIADEDEGGEGENDEDSGSASRISKRSNNTENDAHQMKRKRDSSGVSVN